MDKTLLQLISCPLDPVWTPGHHGREGAVGLSVKRATALCLVQLSLFPGAEKQAATALKKLGVAKLPAKPALALSSETMTILPLGASRYLFESDDDGFAAALSEAIPAETGSVTVLSSARVHLKLSGSAAETILSSGMAIDFDINQFPVGQVAQSAVHHMPIMLHRTGTDDFSLYAFSTWAQSTFHWLMEASLPHGIELT